MSAEFDPYHKWLGIPQEQQPPNHYRLLGITDFECDLEVIAAAADRQMTHLRTKSTGIHRDLSQKLLNEVAQAKVVLLNNDKRARYDKSLIQQANVDSAFIKKGRNIDSVQPAGTVEHPGDIKIAHNQKSLNSSKTRADSNNSRKKFLIIQNTVALGLAIIALVSLWIFYPIINGGNSDLQNQGQSANASNSRTNIGKKEFKKNVAGENKDQIVDERETFKSWSSHEFKSKHYY